MTVTIGLKSPLTKAVNYIRLLRVKHYIKNIIIFLPLVFSKKLFDPVLLTAAICGFAAFSFAASAIYVINDIRDAEKDRTHPTKCRRPIASGAVQKKGAGIAAIGLLILSLVMNYFSSGTELASFGILMGYFVMNLLYSFGLKKIPLVDVTILAAGFLLRLFYGAAITDISLSTWLCLTTVAASFYLGFGKRKGEFLLETTNKRDVLNSYSYAFLDKSMSMCMTLALVFYSLWTLDVSYVYGTATIWTVPFLLLIVLRYNFNIEKHLDGDPTEAIWGDPILLVMILIYAVVMFLVLYC